VKPLPNTCPECGCELTTTEDEDETICTGCGLITSMSIEYVASHKIILPYGRH
jgi:transcription initiation factor TFIIIB Brf1 subunit/transcription initiation factor TFIIB